MIARIILALLLMCSSAWAGNVAMLGGGVTSSGAPTPLFSDGFESNDFSAWTAESDASSQLATGTAAPKDGSYDCEYSYTANAAASVYKDLGSNYTEYYVDFWFRVNDVTAVAPSNGYNQKYFGINNTGGSVTQQVIQARTGTSGNFTIIRTSYSRDGGTSALDFTLSPSADTWYAIRIYRKRCTGTDTNDGIIRVWVSSSGFGQGTPVEVTTVDDDTTSGMGRIVVGNESTREWNNSNGTVFLYDSVSIYSGAP